MDEQVSLPSNAPKKKWPIWLFVISYVFWISSGILDQVFRWTDHATGLLNGLILAVIATFSWAVICFPVNITTFLLYRLWGWKRYRRTALLAPSVGMFGLIVVGLIFDPSDAQHRLKDITGATLPASARDIRTDFSGGGFADFEDWYYFRCSREDANRLIKELHLETGYSDNNPFNYLYPPKKKWPGPVQSDEWLGFTEPGFIKHGWPDPKNWSEPQMYDGQSGDGKWQYHMLIDGEHQQVYLNIYCF